MLASLKLKCFWASNGRIAIAPQAEAHSSTAGAHICARSHASMQSLQKRCMQAEMARVFFTMPAGGPAAVAPGELAANAAQRGKLIEVGCRGVEEEVAGSGRQADELGPSEA